MDRQSTVPFFDNHHQETVSDDSASLTLFLLPI